MYLSDGKRFVNLSGQALIANSSGWKLSFDDGTDPCDVFDSTHSITVSGGLDLFNGIYQSDGSFMSNRYTNDRGAVMHHAYNASTSQGRGSYYVWKLEHPYTRTVYQVQKARDHRYDTISYEQC